MNVLVGRIEKMNVFQPKPFSVKWCLIYIIIWCILWQDGEIEGSGRVMFGEELQTANGMYDVLMSIGLFPFVSFIYLFFIF